MRGGETTILCADCDFREVIRSQPPGWAECQPGGISLQQHIMCKVSVLSG